MHVFRHPKYYEEFRKRAKRYQKELRERNKSDQVISDEASTEATSVQPGPGHKPQATQTQKEISYSSDKNQEQQASSRKLQAPSSKRQASSRKRQAP